jgi:hypothetical protein
MSDEDLPFVNLAAFCDRVLQERDGTISLIRVIDRIALVPLEGVPPEQMPPLTVHANAVLGFKSGPAQGIRDLGLKIRNPQGVVQETKPPFPLEFLGGSQGVNLVFTLGFEARQAGVYWIDVLIGNEVITSMPLEVAYQAQSSEPAPTPPGPAEG